MVHQKFNQVYNLLFLKKKFLFSLFFVSVIREVSGLGSHPNMLPSTWMGRTHPASVHSDQVGRPLQFTCRRK